MDNLNQDLDVKTGPLAENLNFQLLKLFTKHNYNRVISFLDADYQPGIRLEKKKVDWNQVSQVSLDIENLLLDGKIGHWTVEVASLSQSTSKTNIG